MSNEMRRYAAFFRGETQSDSHMIRVEAGSLAEAARIAEETRDEQGVDPGLRLQLVGEEV